MFCFAMVKILIGKRGKGEELKWESMSVDELATLASTAALFGGASTFVLVGAINSDRQDEFLDVLEVFSESPHTFIFEEEKLLKAPSVVLEKAGVKVEVHKTEKKEFKFDQFGVTAALAAKDKKKLWLGLTAALRAGEKPEALAALLAWKARAMRDVGLSRQLTFLYHDSHRGAGDLELLLERFALKL